LTAGRSVNPSGPDRRSRRVKKAPDKYGPVGLTCRRGRLGGMESQRLQYCLDADFRRLREVAVGADLDAAVPSCPGWTIALALEPWWRDATATGDEETITLLRRVLVDCTQ
jgi:hypothetical protein